MDDRIAACEHTASNGNVDAAVPVSNLKTYMSSDSLREPASCRLFFVLRFLFHRTTFSRGAGEPPKNRLHIKRSAKSPIEKRKAEIPIIMIDSIWTGSPESANFFRFFMIGGV
ncbi:hypothetical protein BGLY_3581 [Bacillus glycinifermentans]|nr:hypothetical protein TH62_02755 [Bacillus sp. TH008]SCA87404.1 hypothetical protein BGLY_3581 [Bacillus glycinifermentans]